jgi:hypothetical protein
LEFGILVKSYLGFELYLEFEFNRGILETKPFLSGVRSGVFIGAGDVSFLTADLVGIGEAFYLTGVFWPVLTLCTLMSLKFLDRATEASCLSL